MGHHPLRQTSGFDKWDLCERYGGSNLGGKGFQFLLYRFLVVSYEFLPVLYQKNERWLMRLNLCMVQIKIKHGQGPNCYGINAFYNQNRDDKLQMYITNKLGNTAAISN